MKPVFIGGCQRSGTTMLGAMLGAHPEYLCPPEMPFKWSLLREAQSDGAVTQEQTRAILGRDAKATLQGWRISEQQWDFDKASAPQVIREIVGAFGKLQGRSEVSVWIDQTPNNTRWAATLAERFPDATFVHLVRDGRAVAASLMRLEWGPNSIHRAGHYWLEALSFGLATELSLGRRCVRIRYEDLVSAPETTLRKLCEEIDIEFHPAMVKGGGFTATAYNRKQHALVGGPPQESRISAWEEQLSDREVEIFESIVADELVLLGYQPRFGVRARPAGPKERWQSELRDLYQRRLTTRIRKRSRIKAAGRGTVR